MTGKKLKELGPLFWKLDNNQSSGGNNGAAKLVLVRLGEIWEHLVEGQPPLRMSIGRGWPSLRESKSSGVRTLKLPYLNQHKPLSLLCP